MKPYIVFRWPFLQNNEMHFSLEKYMSRPALSHAILPSNSKIYPDLSGVVSLTLCNDSAVM